MKKLVSFILLICSIVCMASCSNNAELERLQKENEELKAQLSTPDPTATVNATPKSITAEDVTSVKELVWTEEFINATHYHYDLIVKNTSENTLKFNIEVLFYDSSGNVLGKDTKYSNPVMSGQDTYISTYLDDVAFSTATYSITPQKSSTPAIDKNKLAYSLTSGGNDTKFVLNMTNNDTVEYSSTGAYIIFYNGDKVEDVEFMYASNSEYKLPAGSTEYADFTYNKLYTHYEIYPTGNVTG